MDFAKFMSFIRRKEAAAATSGPAPSSPASATPVAPPPAAQRPQPASAAATPVAAGGDVVTSAIEDFGAIQEILGDSDTMVRMPCSVALANLAPDLRGPLWKTDAFPRSEIEIDKIDLLTQLKRGRVVYKLSDLAVMLPEGWVQNKPDAMVELSLPAVVEALPDDLFKGADQVSDDVIEVAGMRDYFAPKVAEGAPASEALPAEAAAPAAAPAARERPVAPARKTIHVPAHLAAAAWNGVEESPDAGVQSVDINTATLDQMLQIPGIGRARAEAILAFRQANGPFKGIYELAEINGVGRRLFIKLTGLNPAPTKRRDRHEVLNRLLGFDAGVRPTLIQIAEATTQVLGAAGCVIAGPDGIALARSSSLGEDGDRIAALVPPLLRRTRRPLRRLSGTTENCLVLPAVKPPLLLASFAHDSFIVALKPDTPLDATVPKALEVARELEWMLGPRMTVRGN